MSKVRGMVVVRDREAMRCAADSKGSSSSWASRAKRLAAAKRMAVAAWMSAGGGGRLSTYS